MRSVLFYLTALAGSFGQLLLLPAAQAAITLNDGGTSKLQAVARDTNISFANTIDDYFPTTLGPGTVSRLATVGTSSSQVDYTLTADSFLIESTNARNQRLDSRANAQGDLFFSVSADTPYSLFGDFSVEDPGTNARFVQLISTLTDLTTSTILFHNLQESLGVPDESFVLGGTGGNVTNVLSGSLTGTLMSGHQYQFHYGNSIYASSTGAVANATGTFELEFGAAVPEPSSILVWGSLFVGVVVLQRRRAARIRKRM